MFRIWVPDLDSPSYFVAVAAVELGLFKHEGIDIEFVYNTLQGPELMRDGKLDFIGGPPYLGTPAGPPPESGHTLFPPPPHSSLFLAPRAAPDVQRRA